MTALLQKTFNKPSLTRRVASDATSLMLAASFGGQRDAMERYLADGGDINALDSNGWSALTYAVWYSQYDNIRFLLEKGADLALADKQDRTLVMLAMIRDKREIIRLLKHEAPQIVHDRQEKKRKELEAKVAAFSPVLKKPMPLPKSPFTRKK